MFDRFFLAHPRALGQSYLQHQGAAWQIAGSLLGAGLAAVIHGALPFLFETTASSTVARLHERMAARHQRAAAGPPALTPGAARSQ